MAYIKATLADLDLAFAYRYGESAAPSDSVKLAKRRHFFNRAVQYIADKLQLTKSSTVTVSSGTGSLPTDFKGMIRVEDGDGSQYLPVNKEESNPASGLIYWITGDHASGLSLNTKKDGNFTVFYEYFPSPMENTTDVCIIQDPEAVVAYAYGMVRKSETDPLQDADKALTECETRIQQMGKAMSENSGDFKMETLN